MSILPGTRAESARFGRVQAIVRRREPVQFQWWVKDFEPQSQQNSPHLRGDGRLQDCGIVKKCR
jgi:hypothetical protein